MYKVNDYIVYSSTGVCQIVDIIKEKHLSNSEMEYYVLEPVYCKNMTIKTPVSNEKVLMRDIITKEDVLALIAKMSEQDTAWNNDDKERSQDFKAALKVGNSEEWIKLIMTIDLKKKEKITEGKKLTKADDDVLKTAEKQLREELAIALDIKPEEVDAFISDHLA